MIPLVPHVLRGQAHEGCQTRRRLPADCLADGVDPASASVFGCREMRGEAHISVKFGMAEFQDGNVKWGANGPKHL